MGYEILSKVIELTDSNLGLDQRLKKVAGLLYRSFPVDHCSIYRRDKGEKLFKIVAAGGRRKGSVNAYREDEGLAGLARRSKKALEVSTPSEESTSWRGVEDRGLSGYRSAFVYPLTDGKSCYGVLYLKSTNKRTLSTTNRKLLGVIAKQIAASIKYDENIVRLKRTYNELKNLQTRLANAEKLMALGELSATLAHEIKNPLVSIGGFATRLKKKLDPGSPHLVYVDHIFNQVTRLEEIMDDILNFTEDKSLKFSLQNINPIVDEALGLFEEACRNQNIEVIKDLSKDSIQVMADPHQLKIAFDNLIANAIQSMEHGGTLTVKTRKENDWGVVEVSDVGGGIAPGLVGDIFNPFFTTKKSGTGLGLPITHKIITKHDGHIEVFNEYGKGMTFAVKLPCAGKRSRRKR